MIHKLIETKIDKIINHFFKQSLNSQKIILRFILKQISTKMITRLSSTRIKALPDKSKKKKKKHFSPAQLRAQRLFAQRAKAGTLR